jgi:hypothetical protein
MRRGLSLRGGRYHFSPADPLASAVEHDIDQQPLCYAVRFVLSAKRPGEALAEAR